MFRRVLAFELKYLLTRASTYVYAAIWFAMPFLLLSLVADARTRVALNSPSFLAEAIGELTMVGTIVISAIFGMAVCRDFEEDTYQLFFVTPLSKRDYLAGRFAGSFIVSVLIFAGMPMGLALAGMMPWIDRALFQPVHLWPHLQPFLLFTLPAIFFGGAVFFAVGALTRRVAYIYLQGVGVLVFYLAATSLMPNNMNDFWPALLDPTGLATLTKVTKYWTIAEQNTLTVPVAGVMLWNRLLWCGVGAIALGLTLWSFPHTAESFARRPRRSRAREIADASSAPPRLPLAALRPFTWQTTARQFVALSRLRLAVIVRDLPFLAMAVFGAGLEIVRHWGVERAGDSAIYPVTYRMTNVSNPMLIVIAAVYAGELVWRERTLRYDQVHDSLPAPGWINFASQLAALTAVEAVLLGATMLTGMGQQVALGYYRFEIPIYLFDLFVGRLSLLMMFSFLALFLQTVLPSKFLAHGTLIALFVGTLELERRSVGSVLSVFSRQLPIQYSDMNGYGHFLGPFLWSTAYWLAAAGALGVVTLALQRRGVETGWRARLRQARARLRTPLVLAGATCVVAFVACGGYLYYNTRVLNAYEPRERADDLAAAHERAYKQYERLAQPKISSIDLKVDIFPERRGFQASGVYTLVNRTSEPISSVHFSDLDRSLRDISFQGGATPTLVDTALRYRIYLLATPLAPGASTEMQFTVAHETRGFVEEDPHSEFAANGTFFDSGYFPRIGYRRDAEITDENARRKRGLPRRDTALPASGDPEAQTRLLFTKDADAVTFKATVSTSPDQIAVAPGYLQREWTEGGRRYFAYDMGQTPVANFYAFVSARYLVKRDRWRDVAIEVYHDAKHPYNVDHMIDAVKAGLEDFTANFGPYQFRQFRVLEFPRYRQFAQSFPNTVPYSEGIGFIARPQGDDVDVPFYITNHELAHQWWPHQYMLAWAQGSNVLSESLAEYSALMVTEHALGPARLRRYLKHDLDRYLNGRRGEPKAEPTLVRVERSGYIWYQKGALAMYALKDAIGEDRLNAALRTFLEQVRFRPSPYTTIDEFLSVLRAAVPPDRQYLIEDLFETITLFDNRVLEATWRPTPDHRYAVRLKVHAAKLRADGEGNERPIAVNDLIDIGIFAGRGIEEAPLFLEKRRLTQADSEMEVIVDRQPTRAGIDPYNKLIDRVSDDNVIAVTRADDAPQER